MLDEATAHINAVTAGDDTDALAVLMAGRTTLVISHHSPVLAQRDRVLTLERGKIT